MMLSDFWQAFLGLMVLGGAIFSLIAAIGVLRLPDVLTRMHASSKAGTLGCGLILLSVALFFPGIDVVARAAAAILFLLLTTPVAAHIIGRAIYATGEPLWKGAGVDELKGTKDDPALRLGE
ncbi:monovalent cation/H(+) antiporter subunit G [Niveispirillum sp.]|uniref:monovalent cation/H(+) antiporter subunit G n=1 Tax=Niveispirillum sp. TaxID=1917217 RepID=UPI0025E73864|nr:monovalent cation/H(+) antiporter subunit G [Niveispirillum sp.]